MKNENPNKIQSVITCSKELELSFQPVVNPYSDPLKLSRPLNPDGNHRGLAHGPGSPAVAASRHGRDRGGRGEERGGEGGMTSVVRRDKSSSPWSLDPGEE